MAEHFYVKISDPSQMQRFLSTHAGRQSGDIVFTVCVRVCLFVCRVTDFSAKDKASSVKFCTAVQDREESPIFL